MTVINRARTRARTVLSGLVHAPVAAAPDVSRYRAYVLESSLDAIVEDSGVRASDVQIVHERPAMIHELEWRPPFLISDRELADPVHDITFRFYDRVLYQMTVSYDRARTDALTSKDIKIQPKKFNIAGLQLADVLAYPVKQQLLVQKGAIPDPGEVFGKKIYGAVAAKFNRNEWRGHVQGYGIKWL